MSQLNSPRSYDAGWIPAFLAGESVRRFRGSELLPTLEVKKLKRRFTPPEGQLRTRKIQTTGQCARFSEMAAEDKGQCFSPFYCAIALAVAEKALLALPPIKRMVPTTKTRITASITAYSAIS
jgi:hypothetical protein